MAMTPKAMADFIIEKVRDIDQPKDAVNAFYSALCDYVEGNMEILYSWTATTPPPASTPDPMVVINAEVITSGTMTPSGATTPESACSLFSSVLNTNAALWEVKWPEKFALTPAFIIPTIVITPSGATDMDSAWLKVCTQIISGLEAATPATSGTHGSYTGVGSFTKIL